jgi:hypothetical protein
MKNLIIIILTLFTGCSTEKENKERSTPTIKMDSSIKQQEAPTESKIIESIDQALLRVKLVDNLFVNSSYFLTTDYDYENREALARCGCCSSEIVFLNDSLFVYSTRCDGGEYFTRGTYWGTKSTLTLQYDSLLVSDIQPFGDEEDIGQFGLFEERKYIKPTEYRIEKCGQNIMLHYNEPYNHEFGTVNSEMKNLPSIMDNEKSEVNQKLKKSW